MNRPPVSFESHRPERRRRGSITLYGTCTCCSCCCLHAVGGVIGAAIAPTLGSGRPPSLFYYEAESSLAPLVPPATGLKTVESALQFAPSRPSVRLAGDEDRPAVRRPGGQGSSAVVLFWWVFLGLSLAGVVGVAQVVRCDVVNALLILALVLPAVQIVSVLLVLPILLFSSRPDRGYQVRQLGRITLGTLFGTLVGVLLMLAIRSLL